MSVAPENCGLKFNPGDTIEILLKLCDTPDLCGPNCDVYCWQFCLIPTLDCAQIPNPFTPNGDGINDYAQFSFPGIGYREGDIHIFNMYNIQVNHIDIPTGGSAKEHAVWNGTNDDGKPLPQGLYLWIIESNGEIMCEGTTVIAR